MYISSKNNYISDIFNFTYPSNILQATSASVKSQPSSQTGLLLMKRLPSRLVVPPRSSTVGGVSVAALMVVGMSGLLGLKLVVEVVGEASVGRGQLQQSTAINKGIPIHIVAILLTCIVSNHCQCFHNIVKTISHGTSNTAEHVLTNRCDASVLCLEYYPRPPLPPST